MRLVLDLGLHGAVAVAVHSMLPVTAAALCFLEVVKTVSTPLLAETIRGTREHQ